ncbi:hypothetical protein, partial [Streptomyces olivaceoviridis]|uniref:hypothetical protein n=1 Tax=Streptomyces olivaceoviridis TaxID=1921 RepID=UPI0036FCB149
RGAGPFGLRPKKRAGALRAPAAPAPRERERFASLTARRGALRAPRQLQAIRPALRAGGRPPADPVASAALQPPRYPAT